MVYLGRDYHVKPCSDAEEKVAWLDCDVGDDRLDEVVPEHATPRDDELPPAAEDLAAHLGR